MNSNPRTINDEKTIQDDYELQALTKGMTLCGKYCLELEAGKGGMGVVWKAWDSVGERWVALKFVPPEIRHKESAMAQVKTVFQTVQALNHANICPVYGLENDSVYGYFIVKKWLDGQSLSERKLPREQIVSVLEKVADALDYAHSEGVLHRDVKPSNIFFGTDGKVTLIDFGIAVNLHSETQATQGQFSTSGTDKYMAPEQRTGHLQNAQTDEYSLALVALELLAGTLSPLAYGKISPEIQTVMNKALSDTPKNRYTTCRGFVDALTVAMFSPQAKTRPAEKERKPSALERKSGAFEKKTGENETKSGEFNSLIARERNQAKEKRMREIQTLEERIQREFKAASYREAIKHLKRLLELKPDDGNAKWLLEKCNAEVKAKNQQIKFGILSIGTLVTGFLILSIFKFIGDGLSSSNLFDNLLSLIIGIPGLIVLFVLAVVICILWKDKWWLE